MLPLLGAVIMLYLNAHVNYFCRPKREKMLKVPGFDIFAKTTYPILSFFFFPMRLVLSPTNERRQESKCILLASKPYVACLLQQKQHDGLLSLRFLQS